MVYAAVGKTKAHQLSANAKALLYQYANVMIMTNTKIRPSKPQSV